MTSLIRKIAILAGLIAILPPAALSAWQDLVADRAYLRINSSGGVEVPRPTPGQMVYFIADVTAFGFTTTTVVPYHVFLDGAQVCTGFFTIQAYVGSALTGGSPQCGTGWQATAGTHIVRWDLNYDGSVTDAESSNNSVLDVFTVAPSTTVPTADIVAKRVYFLSALSGGVEVPHPVTGQTLYMAIDWETKGAGGPITFVSRVGVDAAYVDCGDLNLFSGVAVPQTYTSVCGRPWVATAGLAHNLSWHLDSTDGVWETAEFNNAASSVFNVFTPGAAPTIDLKVNRLFLTPSTSVTLAAIDSPTPGQTLDLWVETTQTGFTGNIILSTSVLFDGAPASCSGHWGMSDQTRYTRCALNWTATPGTHTFQVRLDSDNLIPETDETDNGGTLTVTVSSPGGATNLAQGKLTSQSSDYSNPSDTGSQKAVDGATDGDFNHFSVASTQSELNAWWQVDLGAQVAIGSVTIWNRTDCCGDRLGDYWVFASNTPFTAADTPSTLLNRPGVFASHQITVPDPAVSIPVDAPGRYVRVQLSGTNYLSLAEVQVFAKPPLVVSHTGSFVQGQPAARYTIQVQNAGALSSLGAVTVADTLPPGLTATSIAGPGWACVLATLTCLRNEPLAAAAAWPPITLTVSVAANAAPTLTNQVVLSGALGIASVNDVTTVHAAFVDVSPADPFLPAIDLLLESGITSGCSTLPPGYCPADNISLAQMAVFVVRAVEGGDSFTYSPTPYFNDVPATHPYFKWIQKMQELGIATPCAPAQFCPDTAVNRGVMALLIIRARLGTAIPAGYPATPYFADVPATHPYFPWVQKMRQLGITAGCSSDNYCPGDPVTRGQMAVLLMRGAFNQLLPATTPIVSWVSAEGLFRANSATVTIIGQNTHFAAGSTQVNAGGGVVVNNIAVVNSTTLTAQLTVALNAQPGPRSITVTTGSEEATLPNGFQVW